PLPSRATLTAYRCGRDIKMPRCVELRRRSHMDDMIEVQFVGGPVDGGTLPVPREAVEDDPAPGFDFVPEDGSGAPEHAPSELYKAAGGGTPAECHCRGWVHYDSALP